MSDDINVNKISPKQERRAEHVKDKLEKQGMGQDQAEEESLRRVVAEQGYSSGGGNAGGESHKNSERRQGGEEETG
ncbi:hypothetical protein TA3x_003804 [Tundrisphaera sp. TA3]|uniref:hypothetical protein n=1 Tax=Tundrisphaera sp. TA3 TaxID=3435775 RepID=UPI003EC0DB76